MGHHLVGASNENATGSSVARAQCLRRSCRANVGYLAARVAVDSNSTTTEVIRRNRHTASHWSDGPRNLAQRRCSRLLLVLTAATTATVIAGTTVVASGLNSWLHDLNLLHFMHVHPTEPSDEDQRSTRHGAKDLNEDRPQGATRARDLQVMRLTRRRGERHVARCW